MARASISTSTRFQLGAHAVFLCKAALLQRSNCTVICPKYPQPRKRAAAPLISRLLLFNPLQMRQAQDVTTCLGGRLTSAMERVKFKTIRSRSIFLEK